MYFCRSAAVSNSSNAAARRSTADDDDEEEEGSRLYVLFEEGRLTAYRYAPAAAPADDEVVTTGGARRSSGNLLSPAWKFVIRLFAATVTLAAAAFVISLVASCESWTEAAPLLASLVMLPIMGAFIWAITLD